MFNFTLGLIVGLFVSMLVFSLLAIFSVDINWTIMTNVVIAFASVLAVLIHYDSVQKQKRARVWEINKDLLLNLAKSLSEAIEVTGKLADDEFDKMNGVVPSNNPQNTSETYINLSKDISLSLNVYKPLMSSELVEAIESFQEAERNIDESVENDAINLFEAYDAICGQQKTLHQLISGFIKRAANVEHT